MIRSAAHSIRAEVSWPAPKRKVAVPRPHRVPAVSRLHRWRWPLGEYIVAGFAPPILQVVPELLEQELQWVDGERLLLADDGDWLPANTCRTSSRSSSGTPSRSAIATW